MYGPGVPWCGLGSPTGHWARPGLVKVGRWISPDTDLQPIPILPTREDHLATAVWIETGMGNPRGAKGPCQRVNAPGGMIRLSSDWIAGFTADVNWWMGYLAPDRGQGKLPPQERIVPGDGERESMAWAAGWVIASIGCWTMVMIGASPGRRLIRPAAATDSKPLGGQHRPAGVFRLRGRSLNSQGSLGTRPFPAAVSKQSPCAGAIASQPTRQRRAAPANCRPRTPRRVRSRILPGPC